MRTEAVQIEVQAGPVPSSEQVRAPGGGEAKQDEEQALVPEYVSQYVSGTRLPATAWPRQTPALNGQKWLKVRTVPISNEGSVLIPEYVNQYVSGTHLPATAWPRQMLAFIHEPPLAGNSGWLYRLGCRVPTYEFGARGREPPGTEITEQVVSQGKS